MGIPIVPPPKAPPAFECPVCFDPGETPEILWCLIAGIDLGPAWAPGMLTPPNGVYPLAAIGACLWFGGTPAYDIFYATGLPGSWLQIRHNFRLQFWNGIDGANCEAWFDMIVDGGLAPFFTDGFGIVTITADCPIVSLTALAESVGLHPGPDLFVEGWPKAAQEAVIRYADQPESTNVKILLDCS